MKKFSVLTLAALAVTPSVLRAADWPQWGGTNHKNMVSTETGLPTEFAVGEGATLEEIAKSGKNLKWVAKVGSQTYGTPSIAVGRVLVGTNNNEPRNPKISGDRGVVMSFDEKIKHFCHIYFSCTELIEMAQTFHLVSIGLQFFILYGFDK